MKFWFFGCLSLLLLALSACETLPSAPTPAPSAVRAPTAVPVPTVDPSWDRFTAFDLSYSFAHPSDWTFDAMPGQTMLFNVPNGAGFATVVLDGALLREPEQSGLALDQRLAAQAARNGDQYTKVSAGRWPQIATSHYTVEYMTVEPTQKLRTYHVAFLIATPYQQTLFAQYFRLETQDINAAERQMLSGVISSLLFAPR